MTRSLPSVRPRLTVVYHNRIGFADVFGLHIMRMNKVETDQSPVLRPRRPSGPEVTGVPRLSDHAHCAVLSALFRGSLCEQLATGPTRTLVPGELLYHIGGDARSVFLVRRGLVKTSVVSPGGQELTLRVHKSGDVFGELCLCTGERREQAAALEASDVVEIPVEKFMARLQTDPAAAFDFATTVCERLGDAHERLRSLAVDPVLGRLVRTLLTLASEIGELTPDGMQIGHRLAQEELAQIVGARREVVSTLLNRLRDKGLLTYTRGGLICIDPVRLRHLCNWLDADRGEHNPMLAR